MAGEFNFEQAVAALGARSIGGEYLALCPAHEDTHPSLLISRGRKKAVVFTCRTSCCGQMELFKKCLAKIRLSGYVGSKAAPPLPAAEKIKRPWDFTLARLERAEKALGQAGKFLISREINGATARRLRFGVEFGRLIMPTFVDGALVAVKMRSLDPNCHRDYKWYKHNRDAGVYWLFDRTAALGGSAGDDLYVTESELDCAMLQTMGIRAVSVDSCRHELCAPDIALLRAFPGTIIAAHDTDSRGEAGALRNAREIAPKPVVRIKPPTKDLGDLRAQSPEKFAQALAALRANGFVVNGKGSRNNE